jgi:Mg2+ and Co2+ transporter CorA
MAIGAAFGMNLHSGMENMPTWMYWAIFAGGLFLGILLRGWVKTPEAPLLPAAKPALAKKK